MKKVNQTHLAEYVAQAIKKKNWTLRTAAKATQVSNSYLSKLINHKANANPKPYTLKKLAKGLNVSYTKMCAIMGFNVKQQRVIDLKKAIDNDDYLTFGGRPISKEEKIFVKRMLDNKDHD